MKIVRSPLVTALTITSVMLLITILAGSAVAAGVGDPDVSFGVNGLTTTNLGNTSGEVEIGRRSDGGIVVGVAMGSDFRVVGYTADGVFDASFGSGGVGKITVPGTTSVRLGNMLVLGSGKIVMTGWMYPDTGNSRFLVARFTPTGAPDTSFSGDGLALFAFPKMDAYSYGIGAVGRGKLIVTGEAQKAGGATHADSATIRVKRNGSLDRTFGRRGRVLVELKDGYRGFDGTWRVEATSRGAVVLAGWQQASATDENTLVIKLNSDGSPNTGFGRGGAVILNLHNGADDWANGLVMVGKKIVVGIADGTQPSLARLTPTGQRDKTFGVNGVATYTPPGDFGDLQAIGRDLAGNIVGVGSASGLPAFRTNSLGVLDAGFGNSGFTQNGGTTARPGDILVQNGDLVVSGEEGIAVVMTRYFGGPG